MTVNKKRNRVVSLFISTVLIVLMIFSVFSSNAYGLWLLTDVPENAYYYDSVYNMYQKGIVKGYPNAEFKPKNNVTVAEAVSLVFRVAGVTYTESKQSSLWYYDVIEKAKELRIVPQDVDPTVEATRLDIGKYIIGVYGIDVSNTKAKNVFADTNLLVANTMYEYGVFQGVPTEKGNAYLPNESIIRADLCIVLSRLEYLIHSPYTELLQVGNYTVSANPTSYNDVFLVVKALGESEGLEITIPYKAGLSNTAYFEELKNNYTTAFRECFERYPEYFSFYSRFAFKRQIFSNGEGELTLVLSNTYNIDTDTIIKMRSEFETKTQNVIKELKETGKLTDSMYSLDKIRILFEYVAVNTEYDTSFTPAGYTGYGAAINKKAVCQGYTAYFNNLCKQLGFEAEGVSGTVKKSGELHMWSKIKVNNEWRYFDVTFSDPIPNKSGYCNFEWFNLTYDDIMKDRVEDK